MKTGGENSRSWAQESQGSREMSDIDDARIEWLRDRTYLALGIEDPEVKYNLKNLHLFCFGPQCFYAPSYKLYVVI